MTRRWIAIIAWLTIGHGLLGGLYWLLLQIPESNAFMLAASACVVLAALAWAGFVESVAVLGWTHDGPLAALASAGVRRAAWIVAALAVYVVVRVAAGTAGGWLTAHRGEIDAWLIARTGWTKTQGLHATLAWIVWFVRYGIGVALGAALLSALVLRGARALASLEWLKAACGWRTLLITAGVLWAGIWLPWHYVEWRPASLPPTAVQPAFAAVKLSVLFIVANVAWAVVLWRAARTR